MLLRKRTRLRLLMAVVLATGLGLLATQVQTGFVVFHPGQAEDLSGLVSVTGSQAPEGKMLMTTVLARPATAANLIFGFLHPRLSVFHLSQILPPGMTMEQYHDHALELMKESQDVARFVALRHLDIDAQLGGQGVRVDGIVPGGHFDTILRQAASRPEEGEVITSVNGIAVGSLMDLALELTRARAQAEMVLELVNDEGSRSLPVPSDVLPQVVLDTGQLLAGAGVVLSTSSPVLTSLVDVEIEAGEVGGPSAGLMFVLEIINQLTEEDLTGGRVVAGTGALGELGEILPVGGVRQKTIIAEESGAQIFLVPAWQVQEARRAARDMLVIPVSVVGDAVRFLESESSESAPGVVFRVAGYQVVPLLLARWLTPPGAGSYN